MMGDTGPRGPCSEIHYCVGDGRADLDSFGEEPAPDGIGWIEIWNLVFMQFEQGDQGRAARSRCPSRRSTPAPASSASPRSCRACSSNYDTDLLRPLVELAGDDGRRRSTAASIGDDDVSMRVIADHARATAFLIADGVTPSNEGRGYVLRRIMRRAIRHGVRLGLARGPFAQPVRAR